MTAQTLDFNEKVAKDWLLGLLRSELAVDVEFTKADGTTRKMRCTLNESNIPAEFAPKGSERKKSDEVLPVFDLENNGWRSFRLDSVKSITFPVL